MSASAVASPPVGRQPALHALARGVQADVADYQRLRDLLQTQFALALRHDRQGLTEAAASITALCATIEARRAERVRLLASVVPSPSASAPRQQSIVALCGQLSGAYRALLESLWRTLLSLVGECKALNARNCQLLMDQYEIMTRVLGAESDTYAAD